MLKLLIVDDEKIIRETIAGLIDWDALGIALIGTAKDSIEAYNIILDEYPDIVLTDIKMPGMSGLELIQRIHEINKDTHFIILSGYGEFEYAKEAMQYGVKHYLLKPCNEAQIIASLQDVIADYAGYMAAKTNRHNSDTTQHMNENLMTGIISDCLSLTHYDPEKGLDRALENYQQYVDFDAVPYELFYLYYVIQENFRSAVSQLEAFRLEHCPGITFSYVYVHNTLLFFFRTLNKDFLPLSHFLESEFLFTQPITAECKHERYNSLRIMLRTLMPHIRRYETIYYSEGQKYSPIYNYQNVIHEVQRLTPHIYSGQKELAANSYQSLLAIFDAVSDADFLKQLAVSVIITSVSNSRNFDMVHAAEFLAELGREADCTKITGLLTKRLTRLFEEYHDQQPIGDISQKIQGFVETYIEDSELSLKWIAENHLFMNVDYLSKRFLKETGYKFSKYLTDTRIKRAKEILTANPSVSIQDVADMVGCGNNPQYFGQIFKKSTGMTPSKYLKLIQGKAE